MDQQAIAYWLLFNLFDSKYNQKQGFIRSKTFVLSDWKTT